MAILTAQQAYDEIAKYITNNGGGNYSNWYAGIASDPKARLFTDHKVSETSGKWIYCPCTNDAHARSAEEALLKLGCDGASGGGDSSTTWVYAYLKTNQTSP